MYHQRNLIDTDCCPLTLLAADSHALTLAVRGKVREYTARKAGCGLKCGGSLEKFDRNGCWLRMFLLCEAEAATGYSLTWKKKATPAGRPWWVLGRSARRTDGIGPGFWPTATVADASGHSQTAENPTPGQTGGTTLVGAVKAQVGGVNLREACNWPGCSASDANHKGDLVQAARGNQNKHFGPAGLAVGENHSTTGKPRGSLNAAWVRSLLGWPDEYWIALEKATMEYHLTAPRAARTKASCG